MSKGVTLQKVNELKVGTTRALVFESKIGLGNLLVIEADMVPDSDVAEISFTPVEAEKLYAWLGRALRKP